MPLSDKQRKYLRSLAHSRKPVVMIGQQGLKDTVKDELELAINHHELIKVKISVGDRVARDALVEAMCQTVRAELVQRVGNIAVLYRNNPEKALIKLP